jgi:hypothetical protein
MIIKRLVTRIKGRVPYAVGFVLAYQFSALKIIKKYGQKSSSFLRKQESRSHVGILDSGFHRNDGKKQTLKKVRFKELKCYVLANLSLSYKA